MIYMAVFLTSDWHFNHDREFIWKPRGFSCIEEMNETIVERHNEVLKPEDTLYILGDLMLGPDKENSISLIKRVIGNKIIIAGNHDTLVRRELYKQAGFPVYDALYFREAGHHFYLSHYPSITSNLEFESLKQCVINFYAHTHQTTNFYNDIPYMYHVGVDSHNCYPVNLLDALQEMRYKVQECKTML